MLKTRHILAEAFCDVQKQKQTSYLNVFHYYDTLLFDVKTGRAIDKVLRFLRKFVQPCYEETIQYKTILLPKRAYSGNARYDKYALIMSTKNISHLELDNYEYFFTTEYWDDIKCCGLLCEILPFISSGPRNVIASYIV